MLKQWMDAGRCLMGLHQGEWIRGAADACLLTQTCVLCGQESRKVEHAWGAWRQLAEQPCVETRTCVQCRDVESREEHQPGTWRYEGTETCIQTQRCARCHRPYEETRAHHEWGTWRYAEAHRQPVRACVRCGTGTTFTGDVLEPGTAAAGTPGPATPDDHVEVPHARESVEPTEPEATPARGGAEGGAGGGADAGTLAMLAFVRAEYEAQVARGQIVPSKRPRYEALLDELERHLSTPTSALAGSQVKGRRVQELLAGFSSALMDPSRAEPASAPPPGSRGALLQAKVEALHAYVLSEMGDSQLTGETGEALVQFAATLHRCRDALAQPMDDAGLQRLEVDSLRPLALAIHAFALREHLGVARPLWPSSVVTQRADAVCVSGGDAAGALVARACAARALRVLSPYPHREPGTLRWQQLREAAVAVFDFTAYERTTSAERAGPIASVAYEFGIALALGRPVVVLADAARGLPFDLDVTPVMIGADEATDVQAIGEAIDDTLYGLQRGAAGSSVGATVAWMRAAFAQHDDMRVRTSLAAFDDDVIPDAVEVRLLLSTVAGYLGASGPEIICPAWPMVYPADTARTCFHVTAFGPPWARTTREIVRAACPEGVTYVRGDQPLDPDIVRSIWDEIAGASHVVVDLTGLNANVLVELGIAHVLGRSVLLVSQDHAPEQYFPALAKQRVHHYLLDGADGVVALQDVLQRFLAPPPLLNRK